MTHVVTRSCCNDAACVTACPVNCIHPAPGEAAFGHTEMVFIDPATCIDCGACVDVCPVGAIVADYELEPVDEAFADLNAAFFTEDANSDYSSTPQPAVALKLSERPSQRLTVAVVGTGPAASYVVDSLLSVEGLEPEITVLDRLLTPGGLLRHGVAPDHPDTQAISERLGRLWRRPGVSLQLGVEIGSDVTVEELLRSHHAVVLATGAPQSRHLNIPGEGLPGCLDAERFVGWYSGHPDHAALDPDLSTHRAMVVGNGNVALDIARLLLTDVDQLRRTDIAEHALDALGRSQIEEVVVLGRRSPVQAACTTAELLALDRVRGVSVHVDERDLDHARVAEPEPGPLRPVLQHKLSWLRAHTGTPAADRRLALRFHSTPEELIGRERVEGLRVRHLLDGDPQLVEAGLVITAVGFEPTPLPGAEGPGRYCVGWAERGSVGGIGTNKWAARETVARLVSDFEAGALTAPASPVPDLAPGRAFGLPEWQLLDQHERRLGRAAGRPRVKLTDRDEQRAVAASPGDPA